MALIAVFDFFSHDAMHLPFNEGYLRTLAAAFPDDEIAFHGRPGHVAALRAALPAAPITWRSVEPFTPFFGQSRHNPLAGRLGACRSWQEIRRALGGRTPKLTAILGFDANMLGVLRRFWPSRALIHLVLHNHLAETVRWRSRNPVIRHFDLASVLRAGLPANMRVITLELGIREALADYAPQVADNIDVLEHPILTQEWGESRPLLPGEPLRVAFLGHASVNKGFDRFVSWATSRACETIEFHAIGVASTEALAMNQSALTRKATAGSVPRAEYVSALARCHIACLPLPEDYNYVASGSVIDAIAGLKPIFCYRNSAYARMVSHYGPFGFIADDVNALGQRMMGLTQDWVAREHANWELALQRIRSARRPEALAINYRASVEAAVAPVASIQRVGRRVPVFARPMRGRPSTAVYAP